MQICEKYKEKEINMGWNIKKKQESKKGMVQPLAYVDHHFSVPVMPKSNEIYIPIADIGKWIIQF